MYSIIRTIHLFTGLGLAALIFMYAFSGFVILHQDWFPGAQSEKTTTHPTSSVALETTSPVTQDNADAWGRELADELNLRGRLDKQRRTDEGSWVFDFGRPGTYETLTATPGMGETTLTIEEGGFARIMNRLHHFHGFAGGLRFFLWGLFVDLVGLAMIVFPLSGIYMWWVLKKDRRLGWFVLGGSTAYVIGSITFLLILR